MHEEIPTSSTTIIIDTNHHNTCCLRSAPYKCLYFVGLKFHEFREFGIVHEINSAKFEPLHCHAHGQHTSAKFFPRILSKQLFAKNLDPQNISAIRYVVM